MTEIKPHDHENLSIVVESNPENANEQFQCDKCNKKFSKKSGLTRHKKAHACKVYDCSLCGLVFCTQQEFDEHNEADHEINFHQCDICQIVYEDEETFNDHMSDAHNIQQIVGEICEKCGRKFLTKQSMQNHIESNCGTERRFQCNICGRCYMTKASLIGHRAKHGSKCYRCSFCDKQFVSPGELKVHERKHTKEKPFKCDICNKAFPYRESLVTHTVVHTGVKPYLCTNCEATFSCIGNLIKHRRKRPSTCGLPQFCQQTKLLVPRTKTRDLKKGALPIGANEESTSEKDNQIEYLGDNVGIFDQQETMQDPENVEDIVKSETEGTDPNNLDIFRTEKNTDDENVKVESDMKRQPNSVEQQKVLDNDDYDFDQFAVEFLTDENSREDIFTMDAFPVKEESSDNENDITDITGPPPHANNNEVKIETDSVDDNESDKNDELLEEVYECTPCKLEFTSTSQVLEHLASVHTEVVNNDLKETNNDIFDCPYCGESFVLHNLYAKHLNTHGNRRNQSNSNTTVAITKTKEDIRAETSSSTFVCSKCGRKYFSRSSLREHELFNCGIAPKYQCVTCSQFYNNMSSLKRHITVHTGEMPYVCSDCGKTFRTKGEYDVHSRKHTGEKPFQCHICPKSFPYRQSLVTHITTHTGERPFICHCGRKFSCVQNLQSHRRTFSTTCGKYPLNTKPLIQIGVIRGQLYVGEKSNK